MVVSYAGCSRYSADEEDIFLFEERRNARSASKINASWVGLRDHQINIKALSFLSRSLNRTFFFHDNSKGSQKRDFSPTSTTLVWNKIRKKKQDIKNCPVFTALS